MPTAPALPIPAAMLPAGPLNPYDWLSLNHNEVQGVQQSALMRGTPGGMAAYQRRQIAGPGTTVQGAPIYLQSRPFSRGAGAYAPKFGVLNINPIGAGVVAPYKLPVSGGPAARYEFGAIWFDVQTIPTTVNISPTMTMQSLNALVSQSYVAAMYPTTG